METEIIHLANILRPTSRDVFSGKGKLCLSANYLNRLNCAIDLNIQEDVNSFHIVQTSNTKSNLIGDTQFLLDLIKKTASLKLTPDETTEYTEVDITKFRNIRTLEIIKLDVHIVIGLQKLRSQIVELTCSKNLKSISEVLEKCGADNSQPFSWNELKTANFSYNNIVEIDNSFECTLSLNTLDLSHNHLNKANFVNLLPNLKHLNISYNRLENVPDFKGQIRSRLQILVLNNNFIESLNGLTSVSNLQQLDLGHNCLLDHKAFLSISHLVSLQWLNLQGNPLGFHPHHRQLTCNYLNKNASTVKFLLDGVLLNKNEKSLTGSLYPITQTIQTSLSSTNSLESSVASLHEKPRKIRQVTIEDANVVKEEKPILTPNSSSQHLEIKRQVEQLRQEYGESWLYRHSGLIVQDVLGFEKATVLSSTPIDTGVLTVQTNNPVDTTMTSGFNTANVSFVTEATSNNETFCTAVDEPVADAEHSVFSNGSAEDEISDVSDGEDIFSGGEDSMFLATNTADNSEVFVIVTESHISERDVINSKEKARWHINTILSCEKCEDKENGFKLEFDTLRRDRKQRIYTLDPEESETFYNSVNSKISGVANSQSKTDNKNLSYQCMQCTEVFQRSKHALLNQPSLNCPKCTSNMVVES
ncbi:serine/threonine-protein kinase 11-interacting protein [Diabrotica virgifera virgifera]|uniref:LKB1 serine/threonine kinase interacting protein 1 N-terminal domain-containing protein n=1 Tax=Diabrotica virgifera virgifera TaxID=50390 RepID=A0ABM5KKZ3_DIAVI|nr:serine/threonine-protein kinase 11-interacting protein [Diabrotica virgifera virgifera]